MSEPKRGPKNSKPLFCIGQQFQPSRTSPASQADQKIFSRSALSQLRGAPGTRVPQTVFGGQLPHLHAAFTEGCVLACTRRLPGRQPFRPRRQNGHAARRSLKSGQGPSRLLRPGEGKEVRRSAKASEAADSCSAQQAGPSVDISTLKGRANVLRHGSGSGTREEAEKRGCGLGPLHRSQPGQRALARSSG